MTIEDEKAIERFKYRLDMKKMIIDKLLIGMIIGLAGIFFNIGFEKYKNDLSTEKFLLENKLSAITEIRNAYHAINNMYMDYTAMPFLELPVTFKSDFSNVMEKYTLLCDKYGILLSNTFYDRLSHFLWINQGVYYLGNVQTDAIKYREFMVDNNRYFDFLCRKEMGFENSIDNKNLENCFGKQISWKEAENMGAITYLENQFAEWSRLKNE